jgi:hypothetical protein
VATKDTLEAIGVGILCGIGGSILGTTLAFVIIAFVSR